MIEKNYSSQDGAKINVIYLPAENPSAPLVFEIHGGGYVAGHHTDDLPLCRQIQQLTGFNVATVEYRYAPEVFFPQAAYDCLAALEGLVSDSGLSFDRNNILVWGHSAGANAAAALAQLYGGIKGLVLSYPWLDATDRSRPYVLGGMPAFWMRHTAHKYFNDGKKRALPLASPVYMGEEQLKKLPATFVLVSGKDTLREDSFRFESAVKAAGGNIKVKVYPLAEHGFIEVVSADRIKNRLFSRRRYRTQTACYKEAMGDVAAFMRSLQAEGLAQL